MLNPIPNSLIFLSTNILANLNIHPSSLNGLTIWTQLNIWNIYKNKEFVNHQGRNKSIVSFEGIAFQNTLNMSSCGFISRHFFLRYKMLLFDQIILCCNQCSKCFICLNHKFNLKLINCQKFGYNVLVAKNISVSDL